MPLGTEVGLGPGDIVLDRDPALPKKGHRTPLFGSCLLWAFMAKWLVDQMPLSTEVDLGPRHIVLDGNPAPP